ncbi:uncharacterized protein LOC105691352 [Athalia rosae]|uniref:uncharacterized protein LOC105691352 n=1 Tax=Athalia rosae TaxID=37344 RepID=UPI0020346C60|nr:uncharacterized protein LOC105691352 [Athalia rosae]
MTDKKPAFGSGGGGEGDNKITNEPPTDNTKDKKTLMCCDDFLSDEDLNVGKIAEVVENVEENVSSSDEADEELEVEYRKLNEVLDLPEDSYSLTRIKPKFPECVKHGSRSGTTHFNMLKFSPLSRGLQGPACAIAAFATNAVLKSRCWNEMIIDQIIDDADDYYFKSYEDVETDDRRTLTVRDLRREMTVQKTYHVYFDIHDAAYVGTFRSEDPKEMHLLKALDLFFKKYDSGLLISPNLNISIWKDSKFYNIFDGQARGDDCLPVANENEGSAKLILVRDLTSVAFIILEKSNVDNEPFVLFAITVVNSMKIPSRPDDPDEPVKSVGEPKRRPSGFKIQEQFRACVQGTYHLMDSRVPSELRGRGHLVIAVAALIYSRLINSNKWSSMIIDLIFNQAHIYMIDLVRALDMKLDDYFELKIDDLMGDIILGVYSAKINVTVNVVPGQKKKGKSTIDSGIREFFQQNQSGIIEIKKIFFPIWKEDDKFYFLDPFGCDDEGFRIDPADPDEALRYKKAKPCMTMNSSINEMVETILQNTGNKDKDPFVIHSLRVLDVRTGSIPGGPIDNVIYREKGTNRRPSPEDSNEVTKVADCKLEIDMVPRPRPDAEKTKDYQSQFPELMLDVDNYMMKEDEPTSFVVARPSVKELVKPELQDTMKSEELVSPEKWSEPTEPEIQYISGYQVVNPHRLILQGEVNCLAKRFEERARGRQGLIIALTAIAYGKVTPPPAWRNIDVNQIIEVGNKAYADTIDWIQRGRPAEDEIKGNKEAGDENEDEEEEEETEEEDEEEEEDEDEEGKVSKRELKGPLQPRPSHLDVAMLPDKIRLGENDVYYKKKTKFAEGDANPLANLGEALEQYFRLYDELVVENKRLMFGVWRSGGKYCLFNPYGSDEEGRRLRGYPAAFIVTDTINELIDIFYGILEYNDSQFILHYIGIESIQPNDKYVASIPIEIPESNLAAMYRTSFLPVTDEDLFVPEPQPEPETVGTVEAENNKQKKGDEDEDESEDVDEEEEEEEEEDEEDMKDEIPEEKPPPEPERPIIDPLLEVEEQDQPDPPDQLNLSLLSRTLVVDEEEEKKKDEMNEALIYEKLKYKHPPPFVLPPKKVLCVLLEAKKASKSIHSLLSRFSIDSLLSVKKKSDLPTSIPNHQPIITATNVNNGDKITKIIKLPPKKYLFSRLLPTGITPIRAINDKYLQNEDFDKAREEDCRRNKYKEALEIPETEDVPEIPTTMRIKPVLIPLGPPIKTPSPMKKPKPCTENKKRRCKINPIDKEDPVLETIVCKTEDLLLDMIFPDPDREVKGKKPVASKKDPCKEKKKRVVSRVRMKDPDEKPRPPPVPEHCGFKMTDDDIGVINANMCLEDREAIEESHFKQCYFTAILCVLAKIRLDVNMFRGSILDQFILAGDKIFQRTGKLRYKALRWFYNVEILETVCNIILRQIVYADPESCLEEELSSVISNYLKKDQSGILIFPSCCYAFWYSREMYYLFDPYGCDDEGHASKDGYACLMQFPNLESMIGRIKENTGETANEVFRIHAIAIGHMEQVKRKKKMAAKNKPVRLETDSPMQELPPEPEAVLSLIELSDWVEKTQKNKAKFDITIPGFAAEPNFNASTLEVIVLENDITDPIRTEFKNAKNERYKTSAGDQSNLGSLIRKKPYERRFKDNSIVLEPIDLCIMAWAHIHDPTFWGTKTIKGLYEATKDFTQDCVLALQDTTVTGMTDSVLPEFNIANYNFRAAFAPLHQGTLYAASGWNLAMSLEKLLSTPIYSGAIIICGKARIGVMKKNNNYYAWWVIRNTKRIKITTSEEMEELLKLIVREINESEEIAFSIRAVTISYARKMAPDCEDTNGLHERAIPATSLAEIHRKSLPPYDIEALFRKTVPESGPLFILGTVSTRNRDTIKEPRMKRCYFVALLAVMVKRDIIQSPVAGTVDKIIEVGEELYKQFDEPKYHTEHILKNVTIMNRIFDFRDCALPLVEFQSNSTNGRNDHYSQVKKHLKRHFKKHSDGIIHFSNCCYGFWYSESTNSYYYLDPYQCDIKGKKVASGGAGCLSIFPNLCLMARHMYQNRFEDSTGFFIHRIHVESINVPAFKKLKEDPMWVYLDFHWSFLHAPDIVKMGKKRKKNSKIAEQEQPSWNHYAIEVPNLIYSVWATLGCYDPRFGQRAGKNQAGINVAVLAMQFLCHPSRWGPAILDSAVICGDCYHTESLKSAVRKGCRHPNRFNLQSVFKVFPHVWTIQFKENMCGTLYGGRNRMTLAATIKLAFAEAPNILIECNKVVFAVLIAEDGYYVADPRWSGPPLFTRNHGALYVLRCRNMNALIYALTKMLNTNERLEFHITPILLTFAQESCRLGTEQSLSKTQKQILLDPMCYSPARVTGPAPQVPGAITTPDEDSYLRYRRNLREGRRHGAELENPPIKSLEPKLPEIVMNNTQISTIWHLNVGHSVPHKHSKKPFGIVHGINESYTTTSVADSLKNASYEADREYPRLIDFTEDAVEPETESETENFEDPNSDPPLIQTDTIIPPLCTGAPNFIKDSSRRKFSQTVKEMADDYFKKYKHRVSPELDEEPIKDEGEGENQG